jgi:Cytochrome C biogenesis protein transmembrane region
MLFVFTTPFGCNDSSQATMHEMPPQKAHNHQHPGDRPLESFFAYAAGLLTLINPCVLPVLPIVVASSLHTDKRAPVALTGGMGLSFVALGVGVAAIGPVLGINSDTVAQVAALAVVAFGLVMLVSSLSQRFSTATAGIDRPNPGRRHRARLHRHRSWPGCTGHGLFRAGRRDYHLGHRLRCTLGHTAPPTVPWTDETGHVWGKGVGNSQTRRDPAGRATTGPIQQGRTAFHPQPIQGVQHGHERRRHAQHA